MAKSKLRPDLPLAAAALFVSFVIWLMAKHGDLETDSLQIPVIVENVPDNVELTWSPENVPIIVKFPQSQRIEIKVPNFAVRIDALESIGEEARRSWVGAASFTEERVQISLDNVHSELPQSVKVTDLGPPDSIRLEARLRTRRVKVSVRTEGALPVRYELGGEISVKPAEVRVTAPEAVLAALDSNPIEIPTAAIALNDRDSDFIVYAELRLPEGLALVHDADLKVEVAIAVREKEISVTIEDVPIDLFVYTEGLSVRVTPAVAEVRIKGPFSLIDRIDKDSFDFATKESLIERDGAEREIELVVEINESVPREIRERVTIEDFAPKTATIEFFAVEEPDGTN